MPNKKENRGGPRPNSGRPKGPPTKNITFRVPIEHYEELKQLVREFIKGKKDKK